MPGGTDDLQAGDPAASGFLAAVRVRGLSRSFGSVLACDQVDIDLYRGEIHGVLGENGAGKSTLMRMLIGLVIPDSGSIAVGGRETTIRDPVEAASLGIGMVHQHFSLVEALSVWENVTLGDRGRLDRAGCRDAVVELGDRYGLHIDPDARVGDLAVGLRQRVEVLKCLRRRPAILIFDEPTSVLTPDESQELFTSLRRVVEEEGRAVALVSHRLAEVLEVTDRFTVMRQGRVVDHGRTAEVDAAGLARSMVGREVRLRTPGSGGSGASGIRDDASDRQDGGSVDAPSGSPALEVRGLTVREAGSVAELEEIDLTVGAGEVLGLAGVEGNGQSVLIDVLSGLRRATAGQVGVSGVAIDPWRLSAGLDAGIAIIPEDRHDSGVVLEMTVAENLMLSSPGGFYRHGLVDSAKVREHAERLIEEFGIACSGPDAPLWTLSGGNQQRVVLARELASDPAVLVAGQPTRGLDVGAIEYMAGQLRRIASSGVGVLLVSSELDEIFELSDRIAVIHRGRITGGMPIAEADSESVGLLMAGDAR